jgi:hypothetical protein
MKDEHQNRHLNEFNYFKRNNIKMNKNRKSLKCSSDIDNNMISYNNSERSKKEINKLKINLLMIINIFIC